ncbi:Oligo-1,6-glucosidase [compost metagenome]
MESIYVKGRDNARTPFQWDSAPHGGFTTGSPWIAVNSNYTSINASQAQADPNSIYHYYRQLISLRKEHDIIVYGDFQMLLPDHDQIMAYVRTLGDQKLLVMMNFFAGEPEWMAEWLTEQGLTSTGSRLLIGNYPVEESSLPDTSFTLRPYEARVYLWND